MSAHRESDLLKLLLYAYPDRVTVRRANDPARGVMVGGRGVVLEPASIVRTAPLFLSIDPRDTTTPGGADETRVSLASAVEEEWLEEIHPHLLSRSVIHRFDPERRRVISVRETRFADLVVKEDIVGPQSDPKGASRALFEYLRKDPAALFAQDEAASRFLCRLRFLRRHVPELNFPEFGDSTFDEILRDACDGRTSIEQVAGRGLLQRLENRLTWQHREALRDHAPETIEVPSGSRIRLRYPGEAEGGAGESEHSATTAPVLAVRLQELFGWSESPRVARGRVAVVLHLLGPNFRPVQITADLKSFWNTTYSEVRRDLRARYPKHPWPENPWEAQPKAVGGKRTR